ncbi:MAG TPA: LysR family transcriptional regulator [Alphaproteobacteria bacterium]|jgi:DNA-binding transcriptional LysR family regulator|nr:LysR family transcriptional regulator [Alphaproteobacteria bacterium]
MLLDDYEAFCRVAEKGGYAAAARALGGSRSALSAAVLRLEGALGLRLLKRNTRNVRLTQDGEALYRRIAPLLRQLREVHDRARADAALVSGVLRIATPYEFGAHHLAAVVCRLLARHAELEVRIEVHHEMIDPFDAPYDVVFSMAETELAASNVIAKRVYTLERGLFAAPSLLAGHDPPRQPADLARLPLLATPADREWQFSRRRSEQRIAVTRPRMRSSSAEIRRQAALAGLGVARITATYCADFVRQGLLCQVLADWRCAPLPVYALFTERRLMAPKVRALLDAFDNGAGDPPPPAAA